MQNSMQLQSILHAKHANARGSGGMPPQENFKNGCSEIESGGIFDSSVHCTIVHD